MKALVFLLAFFSSASFAAHNCVTKVDGVAVSGNSNVQANLSGIGHGVVLCALNRKLGEYEPEACEGVMSMLLSARMADKSVRLYFRNDDNTNCSKGNWLNLGAPEHGLYYIVLED